MEDGYKKNFSECIADAKKMWHESQPSVSSIGADPKTIAKLAKFLYKIRYMNLLEVTTEERVTMCIPDFDDHSDEANNFSKFVDGYFVDGKPIGDPTSSRVCQKTGKIWHRPRKSKRPKCSSHCPICHHAKCMLSGPKYDISVDTGEDKGMEKLPACYGNHFLLKDCLDCKAQNTKICKGKHVSSDSNAEEDEDQLELVVGSGEGLTITQLVREAHQAMRDIGMWDKPRNNAEMFMLMVCEAAEAVEGLREGRGAKNLAEEMADLVLRAADFCGGRGIDLETAIIEKMGKNRSRAYKHGKEF